jgi:hypothetical protein
LDIGAGTGDSVAMQDGWEQQESNSDRASIAIKRISFVENTVYQTTLLML